MGYRKVTPTPSPPNTTTSIFPADSVETNTMPMMTDTVQDRILANRDALLAFIRSRGVDEEDAEDILQDSLLRALQQAAELRNEDKLTSWLFQIVRNAVIDYYRHAERRADFQSAHRYPELSTVEEHRMLCRCVEALIPTLTPGYDEVLRAVELEGESTASAAARLGISRNNLKVRLHRARAQLRQRLEETCRTCAEHGCLDCACRSGG